MPPIADYVCNSPKCRRKDGSAPVYELPLKSTHCPKGHKRLVRLYSNHRVGVINRVADDRIDPRHTSSSFAARRDALTDKPVEAVLNKRAELRASPYRANGRPGERWKGDMGIVHAVPTSQMGNAVRTVYNGGFQSPYPGESAAQFATGQAPPVGTGGELRRPATVGGRKLGDIHQDMAPLPTNLVGETVASDTEYTVVRNSEGQVEGAKA